MDRRDFLIGASAVAIAASSAPAKARFPHGAVAVAGASGFSQRSVINVNNSLNDNTQYMFINHLLANAMVSFGNIGSNATPFYQMLDRVTGYPKTATVNGHGCGGSVIIPASGNFSGPWVLAWDGTGNLEQNGQAWTEVNAATATSTITSGNVDIPTGTQNYVPLQKITFGTTRGNIIAGTTYVICPTGLTTTNIRIASSQANALAGVFITPSGGSGASTITPKGQTSYTKTTNGNWTGTGGYVVFTGSPTAFSTPITGANTAVNIISTGGGVSDWLHNARWYRLEDEDDLLAGLITRKAWRAEYVNFGPSALRFMNWHGGNVDWSCRWENRMLPSNSNYMQVWRSGPLYDDTTWPGASNQYFVAGVGVVDGSPATTASMQHGESCMTRLHATVVRAVGRQTISAGNINPTGGGSTTARVTLTAHGYLVGDVVFFDSIVGMTNLNKTRRTITAVTANTFDFSNPAGAGLGTFTSGTVTAAFTLQVGTGNDRTSYLISFPNGLLLSDVAVFGQDATARLYQYGEFTFTFDKNVVCEYDGSGNPVAGAWLLNDGGGGPVLNQTMPIEIITTIINELNAYAVSIGNNKPIHMYLNCPYRALLSIDPDYSSGSNFITNTILTALNGSTVNGVTYAGLTAAANIILEYSNELWNFGPVSACGSYLIFSGGARWPGIGGNNFQDLQALRTACMARDVKAATSNNPRVKCIMGIAATGFFPGCFKAYWEMYYGTTNIATPGYFYTHDTTVVSQGWGTAGSNVDGICFATYIQATASYWTSFSSGWVNDACRYNGTDNSGTLSFTGGTGPSVTASFTAFNPSISGTNTFSAGDSVLFYSTVGNVPADQFLTISATGLSGTTFQIKDAGGNTITPNTNGSATCVKGSTTLTVTAIASQSLVVNQIIASAVGHGINPNVTSILSISGSLPTLNVTLSEKAAITNGTTITSPVNGGGNFIGAADQATAIANHNASVSQTSDPTDNGTPFYFTTSGGVNGGVTGGLFDQVSSQIIAGQHVIQYEGGTNWPNFVGGTFNGTVLTAAGSAFGIGIVQSAAWGTLTTNFWNNYVSRSNCFMPALYFTMWNSFANDIATPSYWFSYVSPDSYASGIEGQAFLNTPSMASFTSYNASKA